MRNVMRASFALGAAVLLALASGTSAQASQDVTQYAYADNNAAPKDMYGGRVQFKADGEHVLIRDISVDGHSVVAVVTYPGGETQYWWNHNGYDTTRDVNLDIPENYPVHIRACLGEWSGTPTGGIMWDTCSSGAQGEA